jgi:oxygen-independent coproporphyrinogen-3 oxidase
LHVSSISPLLPNDPPTAAYVHVPFCRQRCGYCNFTLVAGRDDLMASYLTALERELAALPKTYSLHTLYLGGGTPTHLPPPQLERLFSLLFERFSLHADAELTVEANPLDLDADRVRVLRSAGVTRVSLGVQSFRDVKLLRLERDHRRSDILAAVEAARAIAPSVSLDLIFAAPGETLDEWEQDVNDAIATAVDHISVYGLTIEQGAAFYGRLLRGALERVPESLEAEMYELAIDRLVDHGLAHYEVSNFGRPGHQSRHNETYWRGRSYFAFGPGAARYVAGRRETNHRSTTAYIQRLLAGKSAVAEAEQLAPEDRARERLVFGLRMLEGVERADFTRDTGYTIDRLVGQSLAELIELGLLAWSGERLHLTRRGLLVSDSIWPRFLMD